MKKGQTEQIFVYIFALVVIGMTIFLGLKFGKNIVGTSEGVEFANALTDIKTAVNTAYDLNPGSLITRTIMFPKTTKFICFVNPNNFSISLADATAKNLISSRVNAGGTDNFYWQLLGKNVDQTTIGKIKANICLAPVDGRITIKLENQGDYIEIKQ